MRKLTLTLMSVLVLIVFSISSIAQSETDVKQKIEKMNKEMADAMKAGDHEKNLQFYTDDVVSLPSYEKMLTGKDAIRNSMKEMEKSDWKIKDFNFETVSVETNGNVVTEIGKYRMEMNKKDTQETMKDEGKYVTLWEKQPDGSLKIKTEIWNSDNNPWAQMKEQKNMMGESHEDNGMEIEKNNGNESMKKEDKNWDSNK
ncbi:MAG TPA: SgcJ/EcaC family oxidoreductase [Lentimicrobium sp.]|nr:SgcJ/EcaC family oxidoreductase [Lentimicrobium sp.]